MKLKTSNGEREKVPTKKKIKKYSKKFSKKFFQKYENFIFVKIKIRKCQME